MINTELKVALTEGVKLDTGKPRTDLLPFDALLEVAGVLDYGAKKYTMRGACTCPARDIQNANMAEDQAPARSAETHTSYCSDKETPASLSGNASMQENGADGSQRKQKSSLGNDKNENAVIRPLPQSGERSGSCADTVSPSRSGCDSQAPAAPSAAAMNDCMSTTTTRQDASARSFAIPATLVSASLSGAMGGLAEHSPICGVHQVLRRGERNWEKGMAWGRLVAAATRHLFAWGTGQDMDPESGKHHLAHFACCALMLLALVLRGAGQDDRKVLR